MKAEIRERNEKAIEAATPAPSMQGTSPVTLEQDGRYTVSYLKKRYEPGKFKGCVVPGLKGAGLKPEVPEDVRYLVVELSTANMTLTAAPPEFPFDQAREVVGELRATFDWLAVGDPALGPTAEKLRGEIPQANLASAWAVSLDHYAHAVAGQAERLRDIPVFDTAVIETARGLVRQYEEGGEDARAALDARRNAIMYLLRERIRLVVGAADYAFRRIPELAAQARSDRLRRIQATAAETRRRKSRAAAQAAQPVSETPAPEASSAEPTP